MAGKFLDLKEAANPLGVSPETLVDMRSRGEIFGYRDGASWKFKTEEVDRILAERSSEVAKPGSDILGNPEDFESFELDEPPASSGVSSGVGSDHESSGLGSDLSALGSDDQESDDSILVADDEPSSTGSRKPTVIGKDDLDKKASESDLKLGDTDGSALLGSSANVLSDSLSGKVMNSGLSSGLSADPSDMDYEFKEDDDGQLSAGLSAGMSVDDGLPQDLQGSLSGNESRHSNTLAGQDSSDSIDLVGEVRGSEILSDINLAEGESGISLDESRADIDLDLSGRLMDDDMSDASMSVDDADLSVGGSHGKSDGELSISDDGDISLGADLSAGSDQSAGASVDGDISVSEDDEISLDEISPKGGSDSHSDVTYRPSESGINLASPSDSGISLEEEPLDLGGSAVEPMEIPLDEEEAVISLDEEADPESATQLNAPDEGFTLSSPLDGAGDDDSDSGSQVIALEDSVAAFGGVGSRAPGMSGAGHDAGASVFEETPGFETLGVDGAEAMPAGMGAAAGYVMQAPVELPYSIWNVLGLMLTAGTLAA